MSEDYKGVPMPYTPPQVLVKPRTMAKRHSELEEIAAGFHGSERGLHTTLVCMSFMKVFWDGVNSVTSGLWVDKRGWNDMLKFIRENLAEAREHNSKRRPTAEVNLTAVPKKYLSPIFARGELMRREAEASCALDRDPRGATRAEMNAVRDGARPAKDLMPFATAEQKKLLKEYAKRRAKQ